MSNQRIYDLSVERQIQLLRSRKSLSSDLNKTLNRFDEDLNSTLLTSLSRLSGKDLVRLSRSDIRSTRALNSFYRSLSKIEQISKSILLEFLDSNLDQIVLEQYEFNKSLLESVFLDVEIAELSRRKSKQYRKAEIVFNATQDEAVSQWAARRKQKVLQKIREASREGLSLEVIEKNITGKKGIIKATHHGALLIMETLHNASIAAAGKALLELNPEYDLDLMVYARLDGGTTSKCFSRNGKRILKDLDGSFHPYHFRCYTTTFPVLGSEDPEIETATQWFARQPENVKKRVLGQRKYEIYQKDSNSLKFPKDFISPSEKFYTLDQVKRVSS